MKREPSWATSPLTTPVQPTLQTRDPRHGTPDAGSQTSPTWQCLSVTVSPEAAEAVANFLMELGSTGIVEGEHDPAQAPPPTTTVQGFFPADASGLDLYHALEQYLRDLSRLFPDLGSPLPSLDAVTSEAWTDRWREHFPPLQVGTRFLLLPPWEPIPSAPGRRVIVIDPSLAFGTGHHATTQGCLAAIESICDKHGVPIRALDLGTGSGILAIALAKLGSHAVWATDTDPLALEEARKNAAANHVMSHIYLSDSSLENLPTPFPLVVANLYASTLIALEPALRSALASLGYAILSGIQADQEAAVQTVFSPPAWHVIERLVQKELEESEEQNEHDKWVTLVFQRQGPRCSEPRVRRS